VTHCAEVQLQRNISTVTLVVPCFNESEVLPAFHARVTTLANRLAQRGVDTAFLFVDDGSKDGTWEILATLARRDPRTHALRFARNRGHQIAVTAGLDHADGDMVVIIDADLQDPPEVIEEMLTQVEAGMDVVHAQRRIRRGESTFKLGSARLFYWLLKRFATVNIVENSGDFRALSRPAVLAAREYREPHRFLRGMFAALGFRQAIVTYDRDARAAGETKYPLGRMLRLAADAFFSFSSTPIRAIVWCSLWLWGLSLFYLGWSLYSKFFLGTTISGWTSVVILLTVFTGLILMSIAVVGSYVGRIFEQGQNQPLYLIDDAENVVLRAIGAPLAREAALAMRLIGAQQAMLRDDTRDTRDFERSAHLETRAPELEATLASGGLPAHPPA